MKLFAAGWMKAALAAGAWRAVLAEAHEKEPTSAMMTASTNLPQDVEDSPLATNNRLLLEDLNVQVDFEDVHDEGRDEEGHLFQGLLIDHTTLLWSPHQDESSHGDYRDFEVASFGSFVVDDWDELGENHAHHDAGFDDEYGDFEGYDNWIEMDQELMNTQEELNTESKDWNEEDHESDEDNDDLLQALEDLASSVFHDLEDENDENESEASEDQQAVVDSARVQMKGLRARRILDTDADWSIPTRSELLELILRHIEFEKREGKIRENSIVESIGMHLLNKHPDDEEWKTLLHNQVMDELTSLLGEDAPERDIIEVALTKAKGMSPCGLEGHCESEEEAETIKNFIKDMLDEYADYGQPPSGDEIMKRLQKELNMDPVFANELVKSNPKIQKFLEKQFLIESDLALSNQLKEKATEVANAIQALAANGTEIDDALAILGMTEDEVMVLIHAMSKSQTKAVLRALHKPLNDMQKKMEEADKKHANDTHVYFEEVIEDVETEGETGERRLKFVPHPDKKSMKDHIAEIDEKLHQRKLSRRSIPADTADFSRRLKDHIEEVQHHVRELKAAACPIGTSKTMCDANRLDEVSSELSKMGNQALATLGPLSLLLAKVQSGIKSIDVAEKLGEIVIVALTLAAKIPKIGVVFTLGKQALGPVHKIMEKVDTSAGKFQKTVGKAWDNSIGRVEDVIGQFDAGAVAGVVAGATLVGTVATSTCSKSLINHLAGFNLVGGMEDAVSALSKYMHVLLDALHGLLTALASKTLKGISNTLERIMKGVDPITSVFQKFEPLAVLIETKVTIDPWFKIPTAQKRFGMSSCPGGYRPDYKTAGAGKTCWEKNSKDWSWYVSIPPRMRRTCSSINMGKSIDGAVCVPKNYRTSTSTHKTKKWFKTYCKRGWKKYFTHCSQDCKSGYDRKPFDKCFQRCPRDWSSQWGGTACKKPTKKQGKKQKTCTKYKAAPGRKVNLNWLGECWQTCKSNERLFLGMCFEKAKLTISIQDIFDAMKKIIDHIKDIPLVGDILHAIESAVKFILKPITDLIEKGVKKLGLDGFPNIQEKMLGAQPFKQIAAGMPKPPDFSQITDFSSRAMDKVMKQLPPPFENAGKCEGDFDCILKDAGFDREKMQDEITNITESVKATASLLPNLTKAISCKQWANHTIPVSDILAQAGFPDIDACDIHIPYCKSVDTSAIGSLADEAMKTLQPILKKLKGKNGRRLEDGEDDVFMPMISLQMTPGLLMDFKAPPELFVGGEAARLLPQKLKFALYTPDGQDARDKPLERPIGLALVVELELAVNLGLSRRNGNFGLGLEFSVKVEVRVSRTWSSYSGFLEEVIKIPYKLNSGFRASRYYKNCYRDPNGKSRQEMRDDFEKQVLNTAKYHDPSAVVPHGVRKLQVNLTESDPEKSVTNHALKNKFEMALYEYRKSQAVSEVFEDSLSSSFEVLPNSTSTFQNTTQHRHLVASKVFQDDGFELDPVEPLDEMTQKATNLKSFTTLCHAYIESIRTAMMGSNVPSGCTVPEMRDMLQEVKAIAWYNKVPLEKGKAIQKCAQFWLRWEDRYDEKMEDYYKQETEEIFTRGIKQDWWEVALSALTLKTDWLSAGLGAAGHGPGGVEWIGEHGAEEMLSWGVGIDFINDGGVSGSRIGLQFNWKWFNGGEPFSFKDNFNGWNVGDINFGSLISSKIDASYDKKVHKFNFIDSHGKLDAGVGKEVKPDGVLGRVSRGGSSGFYAFVQFAGVVHCGKS